MSQQSVIHSTFVIERSFSTSPERVFEALSEPAKKRRWYAEGGQHHAFEGFEMDFRVGGMEQARSRFKEGSLFPGVAMVADGAVGVAVAHGSARAARAPKE